MVGFGNTLFGARYRDNPVLNGDGLALMEIQAL